MWKIMWNQRYSVEHYVYGTEPNQFLRDQAHRLAGPVLCLAEGEGRNGVYLAGLGLEVTGVDAAETGLRKAHKLAALRNVHLHTVHADLAHYDPGVATFGAVVSIFVHLPADLRRAVHDKVVHCLKPGGLFLLEAYTPTQVPRGTGGPKDPALCMTLAALREELPGFQFEIAREIERDVLEGELHTGLASVVQVLARKI